MAVIAGLLTSLNEADIIGATLRHTLAQGIHRVYIADGMSTDGTRDVIADLAREHPGSIVVLDDESPIHRQPYWISRLAGMAYDDGASWGIAQDCDEFWYSPSGESIADTLDTVPGSIGKLYAQMFHHYTWELRERNPKPFPKVAFRAGPNIVVKNGNHEADVPGGALHGLLEIRELQYRSEDHFVRKVRERNATLDPSLPAGEGAHHSKFGGYTDDELRGWWRERAPFWGPQRNIVEDPIPSRFQVGTFA